MLYFFFLVSRSHVNLKLKEGGLEGATELGIRGKLLLLAVGIAVPLVLFGALDLRNMWRLSRAQLDDSIKQQVEFASVVLERWLDDQKKALDAIAALAGDNDTRSLAIRENLENVLRTRPFWMDLRITNAVGTTMISQPARKEVLPNALMDHLVSEMHERNSWAVVTDRTLDEARPIVVIAVPIERRGAVIARIDGAAINELFDRIELSQQVVISVRDSEGHVLYRRRGSEAPKEGDVNWAPLSFALISERTSVVELISPIDGIKRVYGVAHIRDTGLITMIGTPSSTLYEPARRRLNRYTLVGLLALLFAVGAALVIERSIVLPVRRLRSTAQQLGAGNLTARAPVKESGEIGDLATAFNTMAARIKEREERLTELDQLKSDFVSSVSHELKTPLTTIKVLAHLLQRPALRADERLDYSKTIAAECDRQIDFVGNLLDLSRIESGAYKISKAEVELGELIESCVDVEKYRARLLGLELATEIPLKLPSVEGDFEALRRVIRGLVDNAIKYTPEGGRVIVSAHLVDQMVAIAIEDTGQGIPADDLPHIFDKFYRARYAAVEGEDEPSASPGTAAPGVGLGLYLVRHIIEQFGGRITVESKVGDGSIFTVLLPASVSCGNSGATIEDHADVQAIAGS
ncbi:MAG TPA: sensor histidine kinase [Pyrinomonadaceae bacterium]|nr:sensor histidine kinase [Pyrinomonadaceae bacterium]